MSNVPVSPLNAADADHDWDTAKIEAIVLRVLKLPLFQPYKLSYRTFHEFEPVVAEVRLADGRIGWGEGHISPGSSKETREGGWKFAQEFAAAVIGLPIGRGRDRILAAAGRSPVAAAALVTAIEMAAGHPQLSPERALRMPLLTPVNATDLDEIPAEIEDHLAKGFRTFKVKVGKSAPDDLARVKAIQAAVSNRATLRLDANRAFDRPQALAFVRGLDPDMIELFEQPCATDAWDDNAAVAAQSPVPLMLDEPICSMADIERAAGIAGVGYCKIKLKRFSGLDRLERALRAIRAHGLKPVLGDGLSSDLCCWMEACVGADLIEGAGEFNGFLKARDPLLSPGLRFADGHLEIEAGFRPVIDWSSRRHLVMQEISATKS
jgi:L-Ala-D/L-Glu epimerase